MSDHVVRLTFPSKAEYLILVRLTLAGFARAVPVDDESLADLKLAATEACANAVKHAYPGGVGPVRVAIEACGGSLAVTVEDDGVGFDPVSLDERAPSAEPVTEGMGIPLIRAIADDISMTRGAAGGTVVCFTKRLSRGAATPA
jgi:anti-sigma regulatory factor (Ser/Thr protein kinase)